MKSVRFWILNSKTLLFFFFFRVCVAVVSNVNWKIIEFFSIWNRIDENMIYLRLTTKNKVLKLMFFIKFFFSNRSRFQLHSKTVNHLFARLKIWFHFQSKSIIAKMFFSKNEKISFHFRLKLIIANVFQ